MKKFILGTIIAILTLIAVLFLLQRLATYRLDSGSQYSFHNDWHLFENLNLDVIFLGNSRTFVHINPHKIDSAFNIKSRIISQDGQKIDLLYIKLKKYLSTNIPPKELYIQFDDFFFDRRDDLYGLDSFSIYFYNDYVDFTSLKKHRGYSDYFRFIPAVANNIKATAKIILDKQIQESQRYSLSKGFRAEYKNWKDGKLTFTKPPEERNLQVKYLDSLYTLAIENNFKLFFYYPPKTQESYIVTKTSLFSKLINEKNKLYNKNFIFRDFNSSQNYDVNLFYNHNHLNHKGSDVFTNEMIATRKYFPSFK